jgi:hypothetical protein
MSVKLGSIAGSLFGVVAGLAPNVQPGKPSGRSECHQKFCFAERARERSRELPFPIEAVRNLRGDID